ncbi:MAG: tetratricopeptide repeat protein [Candidatus Coatesbacteria bacterium]|nr:tetratricopeptide repeat protein [Candidatus Coatesbacteria bacterium]
MQTTSKVEAFCRVGLVGVLSFMLFISPLARVENDPLGLIKWFVAHCGAVAMLALLISAWAFAGRVRVFSSPIALPILLMIGLSAASLLWASPRFESVNRMQYILLSWAPFFLCLLAPIDRRMRRIAALALVLGVSVCSCIGVTQYFGIFETTWQNLPWEPELGKRVFSTMWNPNFLAGLLILTLPLMLGLARTAASRWLRISLLALYYLNFTCLLFTNSWGGWAGFLASLIFLFVAGRRANGRSPEERAPKNRRDENDASVTLNCRWARARLALIVLCIATAMAFFASKGKTVAGTTVGASERVKMWNSTMMVIKRHACGVGVGNFAVFENEYEHRFIEPLQATTAEFRKDRDSLLNNSLYCHNEFLETALETGFIGLVLLFWFILTIARLPFGMRSHPPYGQEDTEPAAIEARFMAVAVAAGAMAVIAQSIVSYPLRIPTTVTSLAVLLGLFAPRRLLFQCEFRLPWALKCSVLCLCLIATAHACMAGYRPLDAEALYVRGMKHLLADKDYAAARKDYERAIAFGLPRYDVYFRLGEALLGLNQFDLALEAYQRALAIQPYHEYSFFGIAEASRALGRTDAAVANYEKAIEYEPRFLDAYLALARLQRSKGEAEKAVKTLDAGLKYVPKAREMALDAAAASCELGEMKQAEGYLTNLLAAEPSDAVVQYNLRILQDAGLNEAAKPSEIAARMIDSDAAKWLLDLSKTGAIFIQKGKYVAARKEFESILARFSGYPPALSNIGTTYILEGDAAHAENYLLQAISLAPNHASYRAALADVYASQKRWDAAEEQLLSAQRLDPSNDNIIKRLQWLKQQQAQARTQPPGSND